MCGKIKFNVSKQRVFFNFHCIKTTIVQHYIQKTANSASKTYKRRRKKTFQSSYCISSFTLGCLLLFNENRKFAPIVSSQHQPVPSVVNRFSHLIGVLVRNPLVCPEVKDGYSRFLGGTEKQLQNACVGCGNVECWIQIEST